uniref:Uncharacterized protein n=1 Tax=Oryza meridionalis TaxID=40149 RepID=A0A0E0F4S1_9ORYZ
MVPNSSRVHTSEDKVGMVRMAGVGPEWSHSMTHTLALDTRTWPRESSWPGLIDGGVDDRRGHRSLLRGRFPKNSRVKRAWPGEILPVCTRSMTYG